MARSRAFMSRLNRIAKQRQAEAAGFHCPCCEPRTPYAVRKAMEEWVEADIEAMIRASTTGQPKDMVPLPDDPSDAYTGSLHCQCCKRIPDPNAETIVLAFLQERRARLGLPDDTVD